MGHHSLLREGLRVRRGVQQRRPQGCVQGGTVRRRLIQFMNYVAEMIATLRELWDIFRNGVHDDLYP